MDEKPACSNCIYWARLEQEEGEEVAITYYGECRRYPPATYKDAAAVMTVWPTTREDDWCGGCKARNGPQYDWTS